VIFQKVGPLSQRPCITFVGDSKLYFEPCPFEITQFNWKRSHGAQLPKQKPQNQNKLCNFGKIRNKNSYEACVFLSKFDPFKKTWYKQRKYKNL